MRKTLVVSAVGACSLFSGLSQAQVPPASVATGAPEPAPSAPPTAPEPAPVEPAPTTPAPATDASAPPAATPTKEAPNEGRVKWVDSAQAGAAPINDESGEDERGLAGTDAATGLGWSLGGSHFVLSLERLTSLLGWRNTTRVETTSLTGGGFSGPSTSTTTTDFTTSGTDVSFLTAGAGRTASSVPRIAFDGVTDGGFTFGGYLGYLVSNGKTKVTRRAASDLPESSIFVLGGRLGYLIEASPTVGVWLRGGFSRYSLGASSTSSNSSGATITNEITVSSWNLTLDPQLVLVAAPRFAITVGPLLDFALSGTSTLKSGDQSTERDFSSSAFGVTGGAAAIF